MCHFQFLQNKTYLICYILETDLTGKYLILYITSLYIPSCYETDFLLKEIEPVALLITCCILHLIFSLTKIAFDT